MVKEKNQFQEYKYLVIVVSVSLLVAITLMSFIGRPLFNGIREQSRTIEEKRLVLEKKEEKLTNLKALSEREDFLKQENERVLAALPNDNEVARLFVQLERIATESGLKIESVSGQDLTESTGESSGSGIVALSYKLSGTASDYGSFKQALSKMESALRILNVSELSITGQDGSLSLNLTIKTYKRG